MKRTGLYCIALSTSAVGGLGALLVAGPLDPPAGAVAPTYKTLTEVEPRTAISATNTPGDADSLFRITQPGSYYLTGSIQGVAGKHGIEIAASDVTIDLNGFEVVGTTGIGFFSGVTIGPSGLSNITVLNGTVRGWEGDAGVDLFGAFGASGLRVQGVLATGNTNAGIRVAGGAAVVDCTAFQNGGAGITANNGGTITNCAVTSNSSHGISVGTGCLVSACVARNNSSDGIRCANECVISGNACSSNGVGAGSGAGVHATGNDNRIEANNCTLADRGVDVDAAGNFIVRNTCSGNTTDWDIAANNVYGPIIDRRAPASPAVTGFTAADATGSTHPNANFSY
ncbi:MAG: right-handed parallel beta-helix repeat-containing protein [Phycisphaerales bacterium]